MKTLQSFVGGRWVDGNGARSTLVNPATEEPLAEVAAAGPSELERALAFARDRGGAALRALTFAERGELLKALSQAASTPSATS